ncbi:MAG: hypothetical protein LBT23_10315 [Synergistaceae bacterium]|nr:hypothetical protein [Synergistaceae bacterium]
MNKDWNYSEALRHNSRRCASRFVILAACAVAFAASAVHFNNDLIFVPAVPLAVFSAINILLLWKLKESRKRFESFGNSRFNEKMFEDELRDTQNVVDLGNFALTKNWLCHDSGTDLILAPLSAVAWTYEKKRGASSCLVVHFKDGGEEEIYLHKQNIAASALAMISDRAPDAVIGYDKELAKSFRERDPKFKVNLQNAPHIILDVSSPFPDPFFETIVYVVSSGVKRKCLLSLTRDFRLALSREGKILFDLDAALVKIRRSGFGRFRVASGPHGSGVYEIKTYNYGDWARVLSAAALGVPPAGYAEKSYNNVDSSQYALSLNKYYLRFALPSLSVFFWAMMTLLVVRKEGFGGLWEDGVLMGIVTYFLLPLVFFPAFVRLLLTGKMKQRMFPKKEEGE